jgi:methyl-accepting chemotaxis protein
MDRVYQSDLKGILVVENMDANKKDIAGKDRDAFIKADDPAALASDEKAVRADIAAMNADMETANQYFYKPAGKLLLLNLRETMPEYQKTVEAVLDAIDVKDTLRAKAGFYKLAPIAARITSLIAQTLALKQSLAEEEYQNNLAAYRTARNLVGAAATLSLFLGIVLSFVIARSFSVPLGRAVETLEKVAGGDLTASLDVVTRDEVGRMASALNDAVAKLNSTMQEVSDSAANASSSSQQLASASEAIASGAQEQAASLEETSASLEEITATVRQSADNAQQASQLAAGSKDSALQGQEVVEKAIAAMTEINVASARISDIISTIDEIAFQTNLLAVNAAVEAARAGEEGRGFAVVASEVRSLAQRSAVAAKEIKVLIQDSMRKVDAGSTLVNRSGETLQGIVGSVKRVTDIVSQIAAASIEQSIGIEQVNTAMTQMDQVTQSNSAQTEELSATAESLSEQAARLLELTSTFTLGTAEGKKWDRQGSGFQRAATQRLGAGMPRGAIAHPDLR